MIFRVWNCSVEQMSNKPFQQLLFIVRDWPYASETHYGWHGQEIIDEILSGGTEQTPAKRRLRERIVSSFDNIGAFLLPYPGQAVANGMFTGEVQQIFPEFRQFVKQLPPALLAPENLTVKKSTDKNFEFVI